MLFCFFTEPHTVLGKEFMFREPYSRTQTLSVFSNTSYPEVSACTCQMVLLLLQSWNQKQKSCEAPFTGLNSPRRAGTEGTGGYQRASAEGRGVHRGLGSSEGIMK